MNDPVFASRLAESNAPSPFRQDDILSTPLCTGDAFERVGFVPQGKTDAELAALEADALSCMRDCLVRYHQDGNLIHKADLDRAYRAWTSVVINREGAKE